MRNGGRLVANAVCDAKMAKREIGIESFGVKRGEGLSPPPRHDCAAARWKNVSMAGVL